MQSWPVSLEREDQAENLDSVDKAHFVDTAWELPDGKFDVFEDGSVRLVIRANQDLRLPVRLRLRPVEHPDPLVAGPCPGHARAEVIGVHLRRGARARAPCHSSEVAQDRRPVGRAGRRD